MRPLLLSVAAVLTLRICGNDSPPAAPPPAITPSVEISGPPPATATGVAAAPTLGRHGGAIVAVGPSHVEVLEKADGRVEGYVTDGSGNVPPPASTTLSIDIPGMDAQTHLVNLTWDPTDLRYEGSLGLAPARGPVEVHLATGGAPPVIVELVGVPIESGLHLAPGLLAGMRAQAGMQGPPAAPTPPPGEVVVQGPTAGMVVQGPNGAMVVQGPSAGVVVQEPPVYAVPGEVDVRAPGVIVEGPAVEVRGPRAVFVAPEPPPPPRLEVGVGVNFGVGGVVEVEDDEHHHHEPNGRAVGWHEHHGH